MKPRPLPRWMLAGFTLMVVASLSGLGHMLYKAIYMVDEGRGLETYHTFWLVQFDWVGLLIFLGITLMAVLVALIFRLREHMEWRDFEKKYGAHNK